MKSSGSKNASAGTADAAQPLGDESERREPADEEIGTIGLQLGASEASAEWEHCEARLERADHPDRVRRPACHPGVTNRGRVASWPDAAGAMRAMDGCVSARRWCSSPGCSSARRPPPAGAAGIVTHAWMALDAVDHVGDPGPARAARRAPRPGARRAPSSPTAATGPARSARRVATTAKRRTGSGSSTRYVDQIRDRPHLRRPPEPDRAVRGRGSPTCSVPPGTGWVTRSGTGCSSRTVPASARTTSRRSGPGSWVRGGLEAQLDVEVIARHARPTGADARRSRTRRASARRSPRSVAATSRSTRSPIGENMLDVERGVEASWVDAHTAALERAMPWTTAHVTSSAGGVDFGARRDRRVLRRPVGAAARRARTGRGSAWSRRRPGSTPRPGDRMDRRLLARLERREPRRSHPDRGGAVVGAAVQRDRPAADRCRPSSPPTRSGSASRPPARSCRRRPATRGSCPYNPEAGEHVVAFQPAADLAPCTRYRAEITAALRRRRRTSRSQPYSWEFTHERMSRSGQRAGASAP